jgi:hypothetical protein
MIENKGVTISTCRNKIVLPVLPTLNAAAVMARCGLDGICPNSLLDLPLRYGGESGIRTHVTLSSKHAFQACAFSHSAISPRIGLVLMTKNYVGSCCGSLRRASNSFDFMVQRLEAQLSVSIQQSAVSTQTFSQFLRMIAVCRSECASNTTRKVVRDPLCPQWFKILNTLEPQRRLERSTPVWPNAKC